MESLFGGRWWGGIFRPLSPAAAAFACACRGGVGGGVGFLFWREGFFFYGRYRRAHLAVRFNEKTEDKRVIVYYSVSKYAKKWINVGKGNFILVCMLFYEYIAVKCKASTVAVGYIGVSWRHLRVPPLLAPPWPDKWLVLVPWRGGMGVGAAPGSRAAFSYCWLDISLPPSLR